MSPTPSASTAKTHDFAQPLTHTEASRLSRRLHQFGPNHCGSWVIVIVVWGVVDVTVMV